MVAMTTTIQVLHCARCGQDHEMEFRPFAIHPFEDSDGTMYDQWGLCPVTGDPVLMTKLHSEEIQSKRGVKSIKWESDE